MLRILSKRNAATTGLLALVGATCLTLTGAFAQTSAGTFSMAKGSALSVKCANALTNTNVAASSETVNCAADAPTTQPPPPPTTQPPPPPTTTPPPPPSGGQCTSGPQTNLGPFTYPAITNSNGFDTYVGNNEWGALPGTTQTICANPDPSNVTLAASAGGSSVTQVQTYPDIQQLMNDYCGNDTWKSCGSPTDTVVSDLHTLSSNYSVTDPPVATGDWEAAYDIWVSNNPSQNEIMIWVNTSTQRLQDNGAQICNPNLVLGGVSYTYMAYQTCGTGTPQFVRNDNASSGATDILAVLKYLQSVNVEPANATIGELDFGWEICNTAGQTLHYATTGYTLTMS